MLLLRHIIVMVFPFLVLFDLPMGCGVGVDKFASFGKMCPEGRWSRAGAKRISTIFLHFTVASRAYWTTCTCENKKMVIKI